MVCRYMQSIAIKVVCVIVISSLGTQRFVSGGSSVEQGHSRPICHMDLAQATPTVHYHIPLRTLKSGKIVQGHGKR